jgi:hypothetical protein
MLNPVSAEDDEVDDAVLVTKAQRSPTSFGLIYERHVDAIYSYLRSRTGTPEDAADLTQQKVLQALSGSRHTASGPHPSGPGSSESRAIWPSTTIARSGPTSRWTSYRNRSGHAPKATMAAHWSGLRPSNTSSASSTPALASS